MGDPGLTLCWEDPMEKEMATDSSTFAWKIPWMEEPGGLQFMGLQSRTRLSNFTFTNDLDVKFKAMEGQKII